MTYGLVEAFCTGWLNAAAWGKSALLTNEFGLSKNGAPIKCSIMYYVGL